MKDSHEQGGRAMKLNSEEFRAFENEIIEAGKLIDPATAEIHYQKGDRFNAYGVIDDQDPEISDYSHLFFLHAPGSEIWVEVNDLPEKTQKEVWRRIESGWYEQRRRERLIRNTDVSELLTRTITTLEVSQDRWCKKKIDFIQTKLLPTVDAMLEEMFERLSWFAANFPADFVSEAYYKALGDMLLPPLDDELLGDLLSNSTGFFYRIIKRLDKIDGQHTRAARLKVPVTDLRAVLPHWCDKPVTTTTEAATNVV
jgi:hypothetical protein